MTQSPPRNRVLIADDHLDSVESLAMLLELRCPGLTVDMAFDGIGAVERALRFRPRGAVLDIDMPLMDGIEAARRIRRELPADACVLIGVSGSAGRLTEAKHSGAFGSVFAKPVPMATLLAALLLEDVANGEVSQGQA